MAAAIKFPCGMGAVDFLGLWYLTMLTQSNATMIYEVF
jgi:hypothetical protein